MSTEDDRTARLLDALYADDLPTEEALRIRAAIDADPEARAQLAAWSAVRAVAARLPMREPDPQVRYEILRAARQSPHLEKKVGFFERLWQWSLNPVVAGVGLLLVAGSLFVVYSGRQDATPDRFAEPTAGAPAARPTPTAAAGTETKNVNNGDRFAVVDGVNPTLAVGGEAAKAAQPGEGGAAAVIEAEPAPAAEPESVAPVAEPVPEAAAVPKTAEVRPEPVEVPALARGFGDLNAEAAPGTLAPAAKPADKVGLTEEAENGDNGAARLEAKGGGTASPAKKPTATRPTAAGPTAEAPRTGKADERAKPFGTGGLTNGAGGTDGLAWSGDTPAPEPARRTQSSPAPAKASRAPAKEEPAAQKKKARPSKSEDDLFDDAPSVNAPSPFPAAGEPTPPAAPPPPEADATARAPKDGLEANARVTSAGTGRAAGGDGVYAEAEKDASPAAGRRNRDATEATPQPTQAAAPRRAARPDVAAVVTGTSQDEPRADLDEVQADPAPPPVVAALEEKRAADRASDDNADETVADAESNREVPARPAVGASATSTVAAGNTGAATLASARQLRDSGRLAEAAQAYESVITSGGSQANQAAFEAAAVYERLGNKTRAVALYSQVAVSTSPDAAAARARLTALSGSRD